MGTMIHLTLGAFQIDWGKNNFFSNHSGLFELKDLKKEVPDYAYSEPHMTEGYSKPLGELVARLELMGHGIACIKREFYNARDDDGDPIKHPLSFKKLLEIASQVDIQRVTGDWSDNRDPKFVPTEIINRMGDYPEYSLSRPDYWDLQMLFEGLSPYSVLRLLAENPANLKVPVIWPFGETVSSGWAKYEDMLPQKGPVNKFLIVTEGSSDSKILQKAFDLLRPNISEFFHFVDMEEGYPFSGTGNLYKFCQGLVSIGIENQVIILYDNDTEGVARFIDTKRLKIPPNMVVAKLPDIKALKRMDTIGPHGRRKGNINGTAAAIECYLDLNYKAKTQPLIRWSSYNEKMRSYQGALEAKADYVRTFLRLKKVEVSYDFSKIEAVLDHLYALSLEVSSRFSAI